MIVFGYVSVFVQTKNFRVRSDRKASNVVDVILVFAFGWCIVITARRKSIGSNFFCKEHCIENYSHL